MELLLTVDNHFLVKDRGLVITPLLDEPRNRLLKPFREQVVIQPPDGEMITLIAEFDPELFVIARVDDPHVLDPHIVIRLLEGTKELVPVGSQVFVTRELFHFLKGEIHTDTNSIAWEEPWSAIEDAKTSMNIERELYREIGEGHVLFRQPMRVIGRRQDRDDFLFEFGLSAELAVVHLTFRSKAEHPPFPTTDVYHDLTEFIEKRMKPDHQAFTGEK